MYPPIGADTLKAQLGSPVPFGSMKLAQYLRQKRLPLAWGTALTNET